MSAVVDVEADFETTSKLLGMGRGGERWVSNDLRWRLPLPSERPDTPRLDGAYVDAQREIRFAGDGTVSIGTEVGTWSSEVGTVRVVTASWDCEGAVGPDSLYLRASPAGDPRAGDDWALSFRPL